MHCILYFHRISKFLLIAVTQQRVRQGAEPRFESLSHLSAAGRRANNLATSRQQICNGRVTNNEIERGRILRRKKGQAERWSKGGNAKRSMSKERLNESQTNEA